MLAIPLVVPGVVSDAIGKLIVVAINDVRQQISVTKMPTLHFDGLSVGGNGGCNDFSRRYVPFVPGRLVFWDLSISELACFINDEQPGERIADLGAFEPQFMDAMRKANKIKIEEQIMYAYFGIGNQTH